VIRLFVRRSRDVSYLTGDPAHELDSVRDGPALWWAVGAPSAGADPARVLTTTSRAAVVGYDLVVAAPRPISILVALDERHGAEVVAAHRRAVREVVDYLEGHALAVRDRVGGADELVPARWEAVASFTHGINRHGEPHLHDHVIVGARPAQHDRVLDARSLRAHLPAADALYRSSLREGVGRTTPWRPWRSFRGVEMVAPLDEGYRAAWGGRHAERGEKTYPTRDEVLERWRATRARVEAAGVVRAPPRVATLDEHAFAGALEGRRGVARRHVVAAWANAATYGVRARDLTRALDLLYPDLDGVGVGEAVVGLDAARMSARVRQRGARPLARDELGRWAQGERGPSLSR
jgi:hypothetical protein